MPPLSWCSTIAHRHSTTEQLHGEVLVGQSVRAVVQDDDVPVGTALVNVAGLKPAVGVLLALAPPVEDRDVVTPKTALDDVVPAAQDLAAPGDVLHSLEVLTGEELDAADAVRVAHSVMPVPVAQVRGRGVAELDGQVELTFNGEAVVPPAQRLRERTISFAVDLRGRELLRDERQSVYAGRVGPEVTPVEEGLHELGRPADLAIRGELVELSHDQQAPLRQGCGRTAELRLVFSF